MRTTAGRDGDLSMDHDFSIRTLTEDDIRRLYSERLKEDFPPDEVKPLAMILRALKKGRYVCFGAVADESILAYAFFVQAGADALFDYFAVKKELRSQGIGSRFLQRLIRGPLRDHADVLLEVDDPDLAPDEEEYRKRERRLAFYLRNGLTETSVRAEVWHVGYRILALPIGHIPDPDDARRIYASLYRMMMPEALFKKMVIIR